MANDSISALRLQLLARGYKIIPTIGKVPALPGWNTPDYLERELRPVAKGTLADRVARWPRRWPQAQSTGVRIEGGLVAIDLDIDDDLLGDALLEWSNVALPDLAARAPTRFGRGFRMALFARLADGEAPFIRLASRKYGEHRVEIFGGEKLSGGRCSRQFAIYGPHSYRDDGSVAVEYLWSDDPPPLHEIDLEDLPVITRAQALALIEAFEQLAIAAGWQPAAAPETGAGTVAYDITDETRFCTNRGGDGIDYAGLCEEFEIYGDGLRCSSNFMPGRGQSGRRDRCLVGNANRHGVTAVWVPGDETLHFPARLGADRVDPDAFAEDLKKAGAAPGQAAPNWRERTAGGHPRASLHNTGLAIAALGIDGLTDTFHHRMWLGRSSAAPPSEPLPAFCGDVTDGRLGLLRSRLSDVFGLDFTEKHVRDAVLILCAKNAFDPVVDMLAEAEANWDGRPRLDRMAVDTFNCADTPLNRAFVRKTMLAAVTRARIPGCKFDQILVMDSPEGWNKSMAWRVLAGDENFSDESLIGLDARKVQEELAGVWIHENAELAGMAKREIETVKAFASRQEDRARPAYGRFSVNQPRHSIEVGTTNSARYLLSMNGNRRFWPVRVLAAIDIGQLRRDRLQLWGEAAHLQTSGEDLVLDPMLWEVAAAEQEDRRARHPWEAVIEDMTRVVTTGPLAGVGVVGNGIVHTVGDEERVATIDIFRHVLNVPNGQLDIRHSRTLGDIMRLKGWRNGVFALEGKTVRGYVRTKDWG